MQRDGDQRRYVSYQLIGAGAENSGNHSNNKRCQVGSGTAAAISPPVELGSGTPGMDDEDKTLLECNIAFLGSSKVGKSAILEAFLHQDFESAYVPSSQCMKSYKAVYMDGRIYDMTLRDCPGVSYFPPNSLTEWTDYKGYGLHLSQVRFSVGEA